MSDKSEMVRMNICIAFSNNWKKFMNVLLYSLFLNNDSCKVYLLSENITKEELQSFQSVCDLFDKNHKIEYIDISSVYDKYITSNINVDVRFTKYTLIRILIPHLIKEDKILYLDADTLVIDNISDLYNIDLKDNLVAGCIDTGIADSYKTSIGLNVNYNYINAGVLLINLKKMVSENLHNTWLYLINNKHFPCHDQCTLNLIANNKIIIVPPIYNASLSTKYDIDVKDIKIIHYAGLKNTNTWVKGLPYDYVWDEYNNNYERRWIN
jgi:lipopolysaccharide biosynthesis glycosyltransferase